MERDRVPANDDAGGPAARIRATRAERIAQLLHGGAALRHQHLDAVAGYFRTRSLETRFAQVVREQVITAALVRDGPPG